ncbi:DUF6186 family protein [Nocardia beijingensis]|uniref:DUF6186 family protein n=1 Tax=Nocardia beijingensis TaxID=95162 RepID=UPI00189589FC|nr:DUF6186 family protein [Nocardia beijingensis]MBF6074764.1 hypothetical protein [Nocardia beijingensis]
MSDRSVALLGFALLSAAALAMIVLTHLRRDLVATLGETIAYLTSTRPTRITAVVVWAWFGWHFLAR